MATANDRLVIVHDVMGTCFAFSSLIEALKQAFPEQLEKRDNLAEQIVMNWYHTAQRDFIYLSSNGSYTAWAKVLASTLPRTLLQGGLSPPAASSGSKPRLGSNPFPSSVLDPIIASWASLEPRPGLARAFETLRSFGPRAEVWACTNGGFQFTRNAFVRALGEQNGGELARPPNSAAAGAEVRGVGLMSCDEIRKAKAEPGVYKAMMERIGYKEGETRDFRRPWFVASHTWDLFAAKKAGFRTAWGSYEEHALVDVFGEPDVIGENLEEVAQKIVAFERATEAVKQT